MNLTDPKVLSIEVELVDNGWVVTFSKPYKGTYISSSRKDLMAWMEQAVEGLGVPGLD